MQNVPSQNLISRYSSLALFVYLALLFILLNGVVRKLDLKEYALNQWLNGSVTLHVEQSLSDHSMMLKRLAGGFDHWRYRLFGEGKPGVLIGNDGWLFTNEEMVKDEPLAEKHFQNNIDQIIAMLRQLEQQNIDVIVALIPDKIRILKQYYDERLISSHVAERYNRTRQMLLMEGYFVPDMQIKLSRAGAEKMFLKTDTHWSAQGSEQVADALYSEIMWQYPELLNLVTFIKEGDIQENHTGDLSQFVPTVALPDGYQDQGESFMRPNIHSSSFLSEDDLADALFANSADIALVGTSFSADLKWAFADQLQFLLQNTVQNYAQKGQGILTPMQQLLAENTFETQSPKLLIWEIPERYLSREGGL